MGFLRYAALLLLFAVVYFLILRPVKKKFIQVLENPKHGALATGGTAEAGAVGVLAGGEGRAPGLPAEVPGAAMSDVQHAVLLKKQLLNRVKEDPETANKLVQNWIRGPEGGQ